MGCAGYQGWTDTIVQNCEIGWCGGGITNYSNQMGEYAIANTSWLVILRGRLLSITENGENYVRKDLLDKTGTVLVVK